MIKVFFVLLFLIVLSLYLSSRFLMVSTTEAPNKILNNAKNFTYRQEVIREAQLLYQQKRIEGINISSGPCLSDNVSPDWVADIVHNPRESIDNDSVNQCSAYLNGQAHHFVELDIDGNLVRAN